MKYLTIIGILILFLPKFVFSQTTVGFHFNQNSFIGIGNEISIESNLFRKFELTSGLSYAINRGLFFRTGFRYSYPVLEKTKIRIGGDLGCFVGMDHITGLNNQAYFARGVNLGVWQGVGKNWGIIAEYTLMSFVKNNITVSAGNVQLGVTYTFQNQNSY